MAMKTKETKPAETEKVKTAVASNRNWTLAKKELTFNREQIDLIKRNYCKGATDDELKIFLYVCKQTGLNPFKKQIYAIKRKTWNAEKQCDEYVITHQTSIGGLRSIAEDTGELAGEEGPFWCDKAAKWMDLWPSNNVPPFASKVGVWRKGAVTPFWGVVRYEARVQRKKGGEPNRWWKTDPDGMLAKCAAADGLRKAFPDKLGSLFIGEEMQEQTEAEPISDTERILIDQRAKSFRITGTEQGYKREELNAMLQKRFQVDSAKKLSPTQLDHCIKWLKDNPKKKAVTGKGGKKNGQKKDT